MITTTIITNELCESILNQVSSVVKDIVKDSQDDVISDSIEIIDESLSTLTNSQVSSDLIRKKLNSLKNETKDIYCEEFHRLLFDLENKKTNRVYYSDWKPKYTGLNLELGGDGTSAWVSKEGRELFLSQGQNSFK